MLIKGRGVGVASNEKTNPLEPRGKEGGVGTRLRGGVSGRKANHLAPGSIM